MSKDFHGGRTYSADPPGNGPGIGLRIALGFAWLKSQLAQLLGLARATDGSSHEDPVLPGHDVDFDGELRLVSMFQVFDGPGKKMTKFGPSRSARRREADTQDR